MPGTPTTANLIAGQAAPAGGVYVGHASPAVARGTPRGTDSWSKGFAQRPGMR